MRSVWQRYSRLVRRSAPALIVPLLSVLAVVVLAAHRQAGAMLAAVVTVLTWLLQRGTTQDRQIAARAALAAGLMVAYLTGRETDPFGLLGSALLLLAMLADPLFRRLCPVRVQAVALPGYTAGAAARRVGPFHTVTSVLVLLMALDVATDLPSWVVPTATLPLLVVGAWLALTEIRSDRRRIDEKQVAAALNRLAPRFLLYFSGTVEGLYQVAMWLPFLARVGYPFAVVVRHRAVLPGLRELTDAPLLAVRRVETLESVLPTGVGAIFYVNNDGKNADGVRMRGPTHVHLGHGDSEKPPSYAPTTAMFDRIFVAGQAGVDRFARHGVEVPLNKFVTVGRPQLEGVETAERGRPNRHAVLYAPTWRGGLYDMQFGSLEAGETIVRALLGLGVRVIFRPHPYSARDADSRVIIARIDSALTADGDDHVSSAAAAAMSVTECFNASTAAVADVSSVASDYLFSGKPLAIVLPAGVAEVTLADYPFLAACYQLRRDSDPDAVLGEMLADDPLADARAAQRRYYLGDLPAQGYGEAFVEACRRVIDEPSQRRIG